MGASRHFQRARAPSSNASPLIQQQALSQRKERGLTSARKIKANRANARASTGPKTAPGRARAARNALRHGLTLPVCSDRASFKDLEALAREIAGTDADAEMQELARRVAEAQIDLRRVRYARHRLLSNALSDTHYDSRENGRQKAAVIGSFLRRNALDIPLAALANYVGSTPEGPQKFAVTLLQEAKRLLAMDRYERRATFRRNTAIRALDESRARQIDCST